MAIIQGNAVPKGASGFYPQTIDQSLRFEDGDSAYLTFDPAADGDRDNWSLSFWFKRANLGVTQLLFGQGTSGSNNRDIVYIAADDTLEVASYGGSYVFRYVTTQKFRDPSAWYHLVISYQSGDATASDRLRIYLNGERITAFSTSTNPSLNADSAHFNSGSPQYFGRYIDQSASYLDGYLAEAHFTDGNAYQADDFGELKSNIWIPKTPSVTYGTNGFYLPFSGGSDFSGFFDGTGDYLTTSDSSLVMGTGDFTYECWVYSGSASDDSIIETRASGASSDTTGFTLTFFSSSVIRVWFNGAARIVSSGSYYNRWVHVAVVKSSGTTTLYIDGVSIGTTTTLSNLTNNDIIIGQGRYTGGTSIGSGDFPGYISNLRVVKGTAVYTSAFTPSTTPLTDVSGTSLLTCNANRFIDTSSNAHTITVNGNAVTAKVAPFALDYLDDHSGEGNDWTFNNLVASDVVLDSPTNNFCTWNPLDQRSVTDLKEGNLKLEQEPNYEGVRATFQIPPSGKWYFEGYVEEAPSGNKPVLFGLADKNVDVTVSPIGLADNFIWALEGDRKIRVDGTTYSPVISGVGAAGDILQVAIDVDAGEIYFGYNNTWYQTDGSSDGNPSTGTNPTVSSYDSSLELFPYINMYNNHLIANFGQDSTFAGTLSAGGNSDDNGIGDFAYAPPSGYLALCTSNLPNPVINPAQDNVPEDHFNTVVYQGSDTYPRSITGVGFQPDFLWLKGRSQAYSHVLYDVIRGTGANFLASNLTSAEGANSQNANVTSFDSDGFSIGSTTSTNIISAGTSNSYVAWNWKAGGTGVSNTDGSITSTVSANTDAGFSIASYTGTGGVGTVGHGLNSAPEFIVVKERSPNTDNWNVYHESLGNNSWLQLNTTSAELTGSAMWNDTSPTSSVFTVRNPGSGGYSNRSGAAYIAYCFHSVDGFSKVGSYIGNGSSDGTFAYTGFRPKWIMVKRSSGTGAWRIWDAERIGYNANNYFLKANATDAESATAGEIDILTNGFKLRNTDVAYNASGATYVYLAFAEQPFKYSNAR